MANPDISYDYTNALYERPSSKPEDYGFGEPSVDMPVMDPSLQAYVLQKDAVDNDNDDNVTSGSGLGLEDTQELRKRLGLVNSDDEDEAARPSIKAGNEVPQADNSPSNNGFVGGGGSNYNYPVNQRSPMRKPKDQLSLAGQQDYNRSDSINQSSYSKGERSAIRKPANTLGFQGSHDFSQGDNINRLAIGSVSRTPSARHEDNLRFDGNLELNQPDNINRLPHTPVKRSAMIRPRDNVRMEGRIDLDQPDSINRQMHQGVGRSAIAKPRDNMGMEGQLDLDQPDSINRQPLQTVKRSPLTRPKDNVKMDGQLDLDQPDSINRQTIQIQKRSPLAKPSDTMRSEGRMELSQSANINRQNLDLSGRRTPFAKQKDNLVMDGELDLDQSDNISRQTLQIQQRSPLTRPKDNVKAEGRMELSQSANINRQPLRKGERSRLSKPKDTVRMEGAMDLDQGGNINRQMPSLSARSRILKPSDGLKLDGSLDLNQHDSINRQRPPSRMERNKPLKPSNGIHLDGDLDLGQSHKINRQSLKPVGKTRSARPLDGIQPEVGSLELERESDQYRHSNSSYRRSVKKVTTPRDTLKPEGELDINTTNINREPVTMVDKVAIIGYKDTLGLDGDMEFGSDNINRVPFEKGEKVKLQKYMENLQLDGSHDFTRGDSINYAEQNHRLARPVKHFPKAGHLNSDPKDKMDLSQSHKINNLKHQKAGTTIATRRKLGYGLHYHHKYFAQSKRQTQTRVSENASHQQNHNQKKHVTAYLKQSTTSSIYQRQLTMRVRQSKNNHIHKQKHKRRSNFMNTTQPTAILDRVEEKLYSFVVLPKTTPYRKERFKSFKVLHKHDSSSDASRSVSLDNLKPNIGDFSRGSVLHLPLCVISEKPPRSKSMGSLRPNVGGEFAKTSVSRDDYDLSYKALQRKEEQKRSKGSRVILNKPEKATAKDNIKVMGATTAVKMETRESYNNQTMVAVKGLTLEDLTAMQHSAHIDKLKPNKGHQLEKSSVSREAYGKDHQQQQQPDWYKSPKREVGLTGN